MILTEWNQRTYEEVMEFFSHSNSCAICNATGTGKSSVIMKVIEHYNVNNNKIMIVAPRGSILDQFKNYGVEESDNIVFVTYQMLYKSYSEENFDNFSGYSLIVFDELHRTGARSWRKAVELLKKLNPSSKFLGASATPRRHDQKTTKKDMVDILFEGNRAGNISLVDALKQKILPLPTYVSTMYSLKEESSKKEKQIENIKDEEVRNNLLSYLKESEINWNKSNSVKKIFETFLADLLSKDNNTKILIFCKNIKHIKEIRKAFDPIFMNLYKKANKVDIREYHQNTTEEPFIDFRDRFQPNIVQVLYSIDKFNEGIHINNLNAIIMVRETQSEIIYHQQVGRVLSMGSQVENPIIIDLVNNFNNVNNYDIWNKVLTEELDITNKKKNEIQEDARDKKVYFYNLVKNAIETFKNISQKIEDLKIHEYEGERNSIQYFAKKYNKDYIELRNKVERGFTIREAILTSDDVDNTIYEFEGQKDTLKNICSKHNKNYDLIKYRINKGKTIEEAMK